MNFRKLVVMGSLMFHAGSALAMFEAHEWGTFTSLVGSDGITQDGMYHEDEPLPEFVHGFGEVQDGQVGRIPAPTPGFDWNKDRCQRCKKGITEELVSHNRITQKMETPVIYFYSDRDRTVDVNVRFPEGVVTETYPAPVSTSPSGRGASVLANGNTTFRVDVLNTLKGNIPYVNAENIYSHARNVESNLVRSGNEQDKFIFYRGLGRFQPRISITSQDGALRISATESSRPRAAFLVYVNQNGQGQMIRLGLGLNQVIGSDVIAALKDNARSSRLASLLSGRSATAALVESLVASGLRQDEARAMVATWENGYLKVPGLRLLYILPRAEVNQVLPLRITPTPDALERVFVGRMEILLDTEEQQILKDIIAQGSDFDVSSLGRFAEPMLRRVSQVYQGGDARIRRQIDTMIRRAGFSKVVSSGGVN